MVYRERTRRISRAHGRGETRGEAENSHVYRDVADSHGVQVEEDADEVVAIAVKAVHLRIFRMRRYRVQSGRCGEIRAGVFASHIESGRGCWGDDD